MSDRSLQQNVEFIKYADQYKMLSGRIAFADIPRVAELLASSNGSVEAELKFGRDEQNIRIVQGRLTCDAELVCQRCLGNVITHLETTFVLAGVFSDEQARHLPKDYEPLLLVNGEVCVADMIEEELLLSLPMFAYHSNPDCGDISADADNDSLATEAEKDNPFAVLSGLKLTK